MCGGTSKHFLKLTEFMFAHLLRLLVPFCSYYVTNRRLALTLAGIPFEDERIVFAEWGELKPKTPFGQLPILRIDDGPPRGQSGAHLRWIGTELSPSLYPKDRVMDIEEAIGLIEDFSVAFRPSLYLSMRAETFGHSDGWSKSEEGQKVIRELREKFVKEQLPVYLGYLTAMLEKNDNQWLASKDGPTIADCVAVPALRMFTMGTIDHVPADCLDAYPAIVSYIKRFCALPQIAGRYDKGLH
jgi:prostaglandin-H2 D-isomerase / glutathione transferase